MNCYKCNQTEDLFELLDLSINKEFDLPLKTCGSCIHHISNRLIRLFFPLNYSVVIKSGDAYIKFFITFDYTCKDTHIKLPEKLFAYYSKPYVDE